MTYKTLYNVKIKTKILNQNFYFVFFKKNYNVLKHYKTKRTIKCS